MVKILALSLALIFVPNLISIEPEVTQEVVAEVKGIDQTSQLSQEQKALKVSRSLVISMISTAYCKEQFPGPTAWGLKPGRQASRTQLGTVAVDPRVIPLGAKIHVSGYGWAIAEDTGGDIKGNRIDVFFDTYDDAINWGVRKVQITIER